MLNYLKKFAVDIFPSVAATVIGAYIVNHYIVSRPSADAPAATVSATNPKEDSKAETKSDAKPAETTAGVSNLPANIRSLSQRELAAYEGTYTQEQIGPDGVRLIGQFDATADAGQLLASEQGMALARFGFYRRDYGVVLGPNGEPSLSRANFVRGPDGEVDWLRLGGRLAKRTPAGTTTPSPTAQSRVRQAQQPASDLLRPWRAALHR
jgi:hypothetical protein